MSVVLTWIIGFIKIVVVFGTLITIHELAHFTVAKLFKVKVNKFSIGFGPKLICKQSGDTEYTLRLLPFGGFCQMEGEEERSDDENAFNKKNVWQRIAIVLAGPLVNIIFALVVYFVLVSAINSYYNTTVDYVNDGPLYEAGIQAGDKIISVNGDKVLTQREIDNIIEKSKDDEMIFVIERDGKQYSIPVTMGYEERGYIGVAFSDSGDVIYIFKNSPGEEAGVQLNDRFVSINGEVFASAVEMVDKIRSMPGEKISIGIIRDGELITIDINAKTISQRFYSLICEEINPGFFGGLVYALDETSYYFSATIEGIFNVLTGKKTENVQVMGPVGIAEEITSTAAWKDFFYLLSAISLSLGIFNLFPIPALDGGRILIFLIEVIRRKPMSEKVEQGLIIAGFVFIILLAVYVTAGDVIKLF